MITCTECIKQLYPDNPQVKSGRYMLCGCDYCSKPTYYRELEIQQPPEQIIIHRHSDMSNLESDLLQQTARKADYLLKKVNEKQAKNKYKTYE